MQPGRRPSRLARAAPHRGSHLQRQRPRRCAGV